MMNSINCNSNINCDDNAKYGIGINICRLYQGL